MVRSRWTASIALASIAATTAALWGGAFGHALTDPLLGGADQIRSGQLWRLFTAPLIHLSGGHLVWDVGVLLAIGLAYERHLARVWPILIVLGSVVPVASALLAQPGLSGYGGVSGLTYCLMAAAISYELARGARPWYLLGAGAVLMVKVACELGGDRAWWFVLDLGAGAQPVPIAHLAGIIVGITVTRTRSCLERAGV